MPKRVDHELRRRQVIGAVARITARGGLGAATFREVAAEAGVSVSLVQYYFGTKADLLLATHLHVGRRVGERVQERLAAAPDTPRARIRATFEGLIPHDDESREAMLLFVALYTESLTDPAARPEAADVPAALWSAIVRELRRARLRRGVDPSRAATVLMLLAPSLGQSVLGGTSTTDEALAVVDYELDRILAPGSA
jgi:AcrR family transcriptional regulator